VVEDDQPDAREGWAGRRGVTERLVVRTKPGNAGGGKGLIKEKILIWCPGESYLGSKSLRTQAVGAVGLFGLPVNLPSNSWRWCGIHWYRVLSADTKFQKDAMLEHSA
jgi:hypothetical protein